MISKFFKWFVIVLIGLPLIGFIINSFSFEREKKFIYSYDSNNNIIAVDREKEYFDIRFMNSFSSSFDDMFYNNDNLSLTNWQDGYFIPGFHSASKSLADIFFPNFSSINNKYDQPFYFISFGYCFMYNLLPCILIITCFGTISWIFKLWN